MSINSNSIATSDFDNMRIFILSADEVRAMSYGEITKPETVNYRTLKPENGGLFCCKIFGPLKSDECLCGKYKGSRYRGTTCEKCGVEIISSRVRRMRMGHIELASPVSHIWFLKSLPSRISLLLNIPLKNIERVLYFECHIVIDSGLSPFNIGDLIEEHELANAYKEYGRDTFTVKIGSPAIQTMLANLNLVELCESLRNNLETTSSEIKRKKIIKRLRLIEDFIKSGNKPQDMVMDVLPVIPPDLRPLMMLDGGRFVSSDQNDLYRYILNRNNRLRNLIKLMAPDILLSSEKRLLQEAVDALFDNGRRGKMLRSTNKRAYKSLTDSLKGKNGRFRQNLLGKRVDFSGRSVIVVGPALKLHQCGLPKIMALEMFKPFVYSKLQLYGMVATIKIAKRMVQNEDPVIWDVLEKVIHEHLVLLNRAPTLHRLGIQAFEPLLIEGNAIQLHPLVCSAFNADFDGDQMAVHLPLSLEAQIESRVLMMSVNNILGPSNGKPIIIPSKDIVLGLYYLSLIDSEDKDKDKDNETEDSNEEDFFNISVSMSIYLDLNEILYALEDKIITLHTPIRCRIPSKKKGDKSYSIEKTTAGRFILYNTIPENSNIKFSIVNDVMNTKNITNLVDMVYRNCGQNATVIFSDELKAMGFKYATQSGISFGKDDMRIPDTKNHHVNAAYEEVKMFSSQYQNGLITKSESYNKVIDTWSRCTDRVADDMMKGIALSKGTIRSLNSIYMMAESGARGSPAQIKQLAGMRGLMAKPSGEIIETPIIANFREGLNGFEYYYSTHGARKGLADTALKTANSGYLTRRLVDVAQDCVVCEYDCGTSKGLEVKEVIGDGVVIAGIDEFTLGRVLAEDIFDLRNGELLLKRNTLITEKEVDILLEAGIDSTIIRSPLMCESLEGVCVSCYGRDLSTGYMVSIGEAAGVIAAQSVGEPGTQLTMRTFHVGGAASTGKIDISTINALISGTVVISSTQLVEKEAGIIVLSRNCTISIIDRNGISKIQGNVPYGGKIYVKPGDNVEIGTILADWDPHHVPILVEKSGKIVFHDLIYNISLNEITDDITGVTNKVIMDWGRVDKKIGELRPRIELVDEEGESLVGRRDMLLSYMLPINAIITVDNGQHVIAGDVIARIPRASVKTRDITGGLPRVVELFEARKPSEHAIISDIDGYIEISKAYYKSKRRVIVHSHDEDITSVEYLVIKGSHVLVNDGDFVKKGDLLMEGDPDLHDILRILGVEALALHMIMEIQQVYKLQGVKIDNKHIEVILRQMLSKVEIIDHGSSTFLVGECIDRYIVNDFNKKALISGKDPIKHRPILLGITRASLKTESFISAASFQETTRVLTEAAVAGKIDRFKGLKECVTAGKLLPVGTGFIMRKMKEGYIVHNNSLISVDNYFKTDEDNNSNNSSKNFSDMNNQDS